MGEKFRLLDLDEDGELSAEELKEAIVKILKRSCSQEEIDEFIQILDKDRDGKGCQNISKLNNFQFFIFFI